MVYVKEYHTTGVQWNRNGVDVTDYIGSTSTEVIPPPAVRESQTSKVQVQASTTSSAPAGNIFAELNKGGAITSGLKTVTKDMQTWRKEYKDTGPSVAPTPKVAVVAQKSAASIVKGPPKFEYQAHGAKWLVENQT